MFEKIKLAKEIAKKAHNIREAKDMAAVNAGGIATAIIVILVVILIAVSLLTPLFDAVNTATSNTTLTSNAHYASAFTLVYLIPLIFVAGIVVLTVVLLFEKMKE